MTIETKTVTRREAFLCVIKGAVIAPLITTVEVNARKTESSFMPENDYPTFGYEPDQHH